MSMYKERVCPQCSLKLLNNCELDVHIQRDHHYNGTAIQVGGGLIKRYLTLSRALYAGLINFYELDLVNNKFTDVYELFEKIYNELTHVLNEELEDKKCLKITSELRGHFYKTSIDPESMEMIVSDRTTPDPVFKGRTHSVYRSDSIHTIVNSLAWRMVESVASFINKKSGRIFDSLTSFEISVGRFQPIGGAGFKTNDNLLQYVRSSTVLSIDNTDPETGLPDEVLYEFVRGGKNDAETNY